MNQVGLMIVVLTLNLFTQSQSIPSSDPIFTTLAVAVVPIPSTNTVRSARFDASLSDAVAVAPSGWRRTADGWEDASKWEDPSTDTMDQYIDATRIRQQSMLLSQLNLVAKISPVWIMVVQIGLVAVIYQFSKKRRSTSQNAD